MGRLSYILIVLWLSAMPVWAQSQVGDTFTLLGTPYRVFEMEFVRFDTDVPHLIKFPTPYDGEQSFNSVLLNVQGVSDSHAFIMPLPLVTEISGFPARFMESLDTQHFYQEAVIPGSEATRVFELDYNVRITLQIAVGPETVISLSYGHLIADIDAVMTDDNLYDVIPLFDVIPQRAIRRQQLDMLRTLFDHIEIRAKPE